MSDPGRCLHSFRKLRDYAAKGCWEAQVRQELASVQLLPWTRDSVQLLSWARGSVQLLSWARGSV